MTRLAMLASTASIHLAAAAAAAMPKAEQLEADGAVIGAIVLDKANIFDLDDPKENNWLYRWANRLHIVTTDRTIEKQLLFSQGDRYSKRLLDESARILRGRRYLYTAEVEPIRYQDGVVDVAVRTKDVWSLFPELSLARSGGENTTEIGLEEENLFGRGQQIRYSHTNTVDRTSDTFDFIDPHLGRSWVSLNLSASDNSDGYSNLISAVRPFHALDARWSAGLTLYDDDRRTRLYELGDEIAEFRHQREYHRAFYGWSKGLRGNWARRWSLGFVYDNNVFSEARDPVFPAAIPADRKLVYPYLGLEFVENRFTTSLNHDQIGRTEDFRLGKRLALSLGWANESVASDRDALIYQVSAGRSYGSFDKTALILSADLSGRLESGQTANSLSSVSARLYHRQSEKRLFFISISGDYGHALDLDNPLELGGDSGLRGYPLRYQSGDARALLTVEQRYFTNWYPFRLFRVGGAIFFDAGRTWGDNPVGGESLGWLKDAGFGLRLSPTRGKSTKVLHLDVAFPLDGDDSIDDVQLLLEAKRSF